MASRAADTFFELSSSVSTALPQQAARRRAYRTAAKRQMSDPTFDPRRSGAKRLIRRLKISSFSSIPCGLANATLDLGPIGTNATRHAATGEIVALTNRPA